MRGTSSAAYVASGVPAMAPSAPAMSFRCDTCAVKSGGSWSVVRGNGWCGGEKWVDRAEGAVRARRDAHDKSFMCATAGSGRTRGSETSAYLCVPRTMAGACGGAGLRARGGRLSRWRLERVETRHTIFFFVLCRRSRPGCGRRESERRISGLYGATEQRGVCKRGDVRGTSEVACIRDAPLRPGPRYGFARPRKTRKREATTSAMISLSQLAPLSELSDRSPLHSSRASTMASLAQAFRAVAASAMPHQFPRADKTRPRPAFGAATRSFLRGDSRLEGKMIPRTTKNTRIAVVTTASSAPKKGYGYGYGYNYGWSYGHGYGDEDWGGVGGSSVGGASVTPSSSGESGLANWWQKAAKIDKSTIAALGGAALLSYGLISNLFYVSSLLGAMYTACKLHAASPLISKPAMQTFVTTYFGLWMIQNFLRPARMGLSVAISPQTDKIVEFFRRYVPGNRKSLAFALTVFCVNVLGTFAYMFGGFFLITTITGVPIEVGALKSLLAAGKAEVARAAVSP